MPAPSPTCYSGDVDDATWELIAPLLAASWRRGRPRRHADRVIYNAILYVLRGGIPWLVAYRCSSTTTATRIFG